MLALEGVETAYGDSKVLFGVDLSVAEIGNPLPAGALRISTFADDGLAVLRNRLCEDEPPTGNRFAQAILVAQHDRRARDAR